MLEVNGINAFYSASHILHDVELTVKGGARVAILGRNGAGKTTLFKSIMNAGPRVLGSVRWNGEDLGAMPTYERARLGLALVPEDRRIFKHLTVRENLMLARSALQKEREEIPIEQIKRRFPMLEPLMDRMGNELSGGQQQMLAVARGIVPRPKLLLLDEPTEGLAPVIVQDLAKVVARLCDEDGMGLLLNEQNLWFARKCTQVVHVIDSGSVVFAGDWAEFDGSRESLMRYLAV